MKARIVVRPRPGVLDPQGKAIVHSLAELGYDGVRDVRVGKVFEVEVDDRLPFVLKEVLVVNAVSLALGPRQQLANVLVEAAHEIASGPEPVSRKPDAGERD